MEHRAKLPVQVPEFTTGPVLLYDAVQLWRLDWGNDVVHMVDDPDKPSPRDVARSIAVLPPERVYPVDWVDRPAECIPGDDQWNTEACKAMYPEAFCITYCAWCWVMLADNTVCTQHRDAFVGVCGVGGTQRQAYRPVKRGSTVAAGIAQCMMIKQEP